MLGMSELVYYRAQEWFCRKYGRFEAAVSYQQLANEIEKGIASENVLLCVFYPMGNKYFLYDSRIS